MSVNVTVHGNRAQTKKGKVLWTDIEILKKNEIQRRRALRLLQVRQQCKDIASQIRERCKEEKTKQIHLYELDSKEELREKEVLRQAILRQQYQRCLSSIGQGHRAAAAQPDPETVMQKERERWKNAAAKRGEAALKLSKIEAAETTKKKDDAEKQRDFVRTVENIRSSVIASLPKRISRSPEKSKKRENKSKRSALHNVNKIPVPLHPSSDILVLMPAHPSVPPLQGISSQSSSSISLSSVSQRPPCIDKLVSKLASRLATRGSSVDNLSSNLSLSKESSNSGSYSSKQQSSEFHSTNQSALVNQGKSVEAPEQDTLVIRKEIESFLSTEGAAGDLQRAEAQLNAGPEHNKKILSLENQGGLRTQNEFLGDDEFLAGGDSVKQSSSERKLEQCVSEAVASKKSYVHKLSQDVCETISSDLRSECKEAESASVEERSQKTSTQTFTGLPATWNNSILIRNRPVRSLISLDVIEEEGIDGESIFGIKETSVDTGNHMQAEKEGSVNPIKSCEEQSVTTEDNGSTDTQFCNSLGSSSRVELYDHTHRFKHEYDASKSVSVTRLMRSSETNAREAAAIESAVAYAAESSIRHDSVTQRGHVSVLHKSTMHPGPRGREALRRLRLEQEYQKLLSTLGPLSKEERISRTVAGFGDPVEAHVSDVRLKERQAERQRIITAAFQQVVGGNVETLSSFVASPPLTSVDVNLVRPVFASESIPIMGQGDGAQLLGKQQEADSPAAALNVGTWKPLPATPMRTMPVVSLPTTPKRLSSSSTEDSIVLVPAPPLPPLSPPTLLSLVRGTEQLVSPEPAGKIESAAPCAARVRHPKEAEHAAESSGRPFEPTVGELEELGGLLEKVRLQRQRLLAGAASELALLPPLPPSPPPTSPLPPVGASDSAAADVSGSSVQTEASEPAPDPRPRSHRTQPSHPSRRPDHAEHARHRPSSSKHGEGRGRGRGERKESRDGAGASRHRPLTTPSPPRHAASSPQHQKGGRRGRRRDQRRGGGEHGQRSTASAPPLAPPRARELNVDVSVQSESTACACCPADAEAMRLHVSVSEDSGGGPADEGGGGGGGRRRHGRHHAARRRSKTRLRPKSRSPSNSRSRSKTHLRPKSRSRSNSRSRSKTRPRQKTRSRSNSLPRSKTRTLLKSRSRSNSLSRSKTRPRLKSRSPSKSLSRSGSRTRDRTPPGRSRRSPRRRAESSPARAPHSADERQRAKSPKKHRSPSLTRAHHKKSPPHEKVPSPSPSQPAASHHSPAETLHCLCWSERLSRSQTRGADDSASTMYLSPPDHLTAQTNAELQTLVGVLRSRTAPDADPAPPHLNPILERYMMRLLSMNKSHVEALNVSSSDVSVKSDVVRLPSNTCSAQTQTSAPAFALASGSPSRVENRGDWRCVGQRSVGVAVSPEQLQPHSTPCAACMPHFDPAPAPTPASTPARSPDLSPTTKPASPKSRSPSKRQAQRSRRSGSPRSKPILTVKHPSQKLYLSASSDAPLDTTEYLQHQLFTGGTFRRVPASAPPADPALPHFSPDYRPLAAPATSQPLRVGGGAQAPDTNFSTHSDSSPCCPCGAVADDGPQSMQEAWRSVASGVEEMSERCAQRIESLARLIEHVRLEKDKLARLEATVLEAPLDSQKTLPASVSTLEAVSGAGSSPASGGRLSSPVCACASSSHASRTPSPTPPRTPPYISPRTPTRRSPASGSPCQRPRRISWSPEPSESFAQTTAETGERTCEICCQRRQRQQSASPMGRQHPAEATAPRSPARPSSSPASSPQKPSSPPQRVCIPTTCPRVVPVSSLRSPPVSAPRTSPVAAEQRTGSSPAQLVRAAPTVGVGDGEGDPLWVFPPGLWPSAETDFASASVPDPCVASCNAFCAVERGRGWSRQKPPPSAWRPGVPYVEQHELSAIPEADSALTADVSYRRSPSPAASPRTSPTRSLMGAVSGDGSNFYTGPRENLHGLLIATHRAAQDAQPWVSPCEHVPPYGSTSPRAPCPCSPPPRPQTPRAHSPRAPSPFACAPHSRSPHSQSPFESPRHTQSPRTQSPCHQNPCARSPRSYAPCTCCPRTPSPEADDDPDIVGELIRRGVLRSPFSWMKSAESVPVDVEMDVSVMSGASSDFVGDLMSGSSSTPRRVHPSRSTSSPEQHRQRGGADKPSGAHKDTADNTSPAVDAIPEDLEGMFKRLGLGWAATMLRKTQEAMAISSSSSETSRGATRPACGGAGDTSGPVAEDGVNRSAGGTSFAPRRGHSTPAEVSAISDGSGSVSWQRGHVFAGDSDISSVPGASSRELSTPSVSLVVKSKNKADNRT